MNKFLPIARARDRAGLDLQKYFLPLNLPRVFERAQAN